MNQSYCQFLPAVGDAIREKDQIDSIRDGLQDEYNPSVKQMYGSFESPILYDVEALLYVQETQLDKLRQELVVLNIV